MGRDMSMYSEFTKTFLLSVVQNKTAVDSDWRFDNMLDNHSEFYIVF